MAINFGTDNGVGGVARYFKIANNPALYPSGDFTWVAKVFLPSGIDVNGTTFVTNGVRGGAGVYSFGTFNSSGTQRPFVQVENSTDSSIATDVRGSWALISGAVYNSKTKQRVALVIPGGTPTDGPERDITGKTITPGDLYVGSRSDQNGGWMFKGSMSWLALVGAKLDKTSLSTILESGDYTIESHAELIEFWDMSTFQEVIYGSKIGIPMTFVSTGAGNQEELVVSPDPKGAIFGNIEKSHIEEIYKLCGTILVEMDPYVNGEAGSDGTKNVPAGVGYVKVDKLIGDLYKRLVEFTGPALP